MVVRERELGWSAQRYAAQAASGFHIRSEPPVHSRRPSAAAAVSQPTTSYCVGRALKNDRALSSWLKHWHRQTSSESVFVHLVTEVRLTSCASAAARQDGIKCGRLQARLGIAPRAAFLFLPHL
jgi:hypothetical protein